MSQSPLYDRDFYAWANEQAALLREGKLGDADIEHIAQEIESMGKTEKRELARQLAALILHLLKWRFQPFMRSATWEVSIKVQRNGLVDHLEDNPSLEPLIGVAIDKAYRHAVLKSMLETGLPESVFPKICPWSFHEMMDPDFWTTELDH
ncbi:MAG: DUF29 domain-containing protein [Methylocystis sp.]